MSWLDKTVSVYQCQADNNGKPMTMREVLCSQFGIRHKWWHRDQKTKELSSGFSNDLHTILEMRALDRSLTDYTIQKVKLKSTLQCYTPAALLKCKKKGNVIEIERTGLMQLDFDYQDIHMFDIDELMAMIFSLPFICFCGRSASGTGFYALALISEPDKLSDYASHCFDVLLKYGVKADTSKGKKVENLRYLSYDENMMIRENPTPLYVKEFKPKPVTKIIYASNYSLPTNSNALVIKELNIIKSATVGGRWAAVQKASFTLGGLGIADNLYLLRECIKGNPSFNGEEEKYIKCAEVCFADGMNKPLMRRIA